MSPPSAMPTCPYGLYDVGPQKTSAPASGFGSPRCCASGWAFHQSDRIAYKAGTGADIGVARRSRTAGTSPPGLAAGQARAPSVAGDARCCADGATPQDDDACGPTRRALSDPRAGLDMRSAGRDQPNQEDGCLNSLPSSTTP